MRLSYGLHTILHTKIPVDMFDVHLDRIKRKNEILRNLLIRLAIGQQS